MQGGLMLAVVKSERLIKNQGLNIIVIVPSVILNFKALIPHMLL